MLKICRIFDSPLEYTENRSDANSACETDEVLFWAIPVIVPKVVLDILNLQSVASLELLVEEVTCAAAFDIFDDELRLTRVRLRNERVSAPQGGSCRQHEFHACSR